MASLHRSRQWLEALKFTVYVGTPIVAVYAIASGRFGILEKSIEDKRYVVYPPEGPPPPSARDFREKSLREMTKRKPASNSNDANA